MASTTTTAFSARAIHKKAFIMLYFLNYLALSVTYVCQTNLFLVIQKYLPL